MKTPKFPDTSNSEIWELDYEALICLILLFNVASIHSIKIPLLFCTPLS